MGTIIQLKPKYTATPSNAPKRTGASSKQATSERRKLARRIKASERALEDPFKMVRRAIRDNTTDWGEALEIGAQRIEAQAADLEKRLYRLKANGATPQQIADWQGYFENETKAAQKYARWGEIYAEQFKPIESLLQTARREVAKKILAEFLLDKEALDLVSHLWHNTPGKWLAGWDLDAE